MKKKRRKKRKSRYHRGLHISPKAGECKYRSGWEFSYMKYLDNNPDVISYEYEKLVIEYVSNVRTKKIRKYYPDFYVKYIDGHNEVVEIKPKRRTTQAAVVKKASSATIWCLANNAVYNIITEIELKALGLL